MFHPYEHAQLRLLVPYYGPAQADAAMTLASPVFSPPAPRPVERAQEPADALPSGGLRIQVYPLEDD
jgi:hypothetical protein